MQPESGFIRLYSMGWLYKIVQPEGGIIRLCSLGVALDDYAP